MSVRVADIPLPHPEEWRLDEGRRTEILARYGSADGMIFEALIRLFALGKILPVVGCTSGRAFFGQDGLVRVQKMEEDHDYLTLGHRVRWTPNMSPFAPPRHGYHQRAIAGEAVKETLGVWETIFYFEGAE